MDMGALRGQPNLHAAKGFALRMVPWVSLGTAAGHFRNRHMFFKLIQHQWG